MIETLARCFRALPHQLRWRWALVAAIHALAALVELAAAFALYAFLGGALHLDWLAAAEAAQSPGGSSSAFTIVVAMLVARSLLGAVATLLRAGAIAASSQSVFTALVRRDLTSGLTTGRDGESSARGVWRAMRVSDVAYRVVAASGVTILAEGLAAVAVVVAMALVAPITAVGGAVAVGAVGGAIVLLTRGVAARIGAESHVREGDVAAAMHSVFGVSREIRSKRGEARFTEFLARVHRARTVPQRRHIALLGLPRHVIELCFVAALAAVVGLTWRTGRSEEFVAILGVLAYAGFRLVPAANRIVFAVDEIRHEHAALAWLGGLAPEPDAQRGMPTAEPPPVGVIELRGVVQRHPGADGDALAGIDLTIRPGERVGLLGESGSGKSTLVDLLSGLVTPTGGSVTIRGLPADEWLQSGGKLGLVPQGALLLDGTVRENIELGTPRSRDELDRAIAIASAGPLIAALPEGVETRVGERGGALSGGERQRIAIARAVVDRPALLLLDEATSALDQPTEKRILDALTRDEGTTIVIAAHRPRSLAICDRIVVLRRGRLVAEGTATELARTSEEFRRLILEGDRELRSSDRTPGEDAP